MSEGLSALLPIRPRTELTETNMWMTINVFMWARPKRPPWSFAVHHPHLEGDRLWVPWDRLGTNGRNAWWNDCSEQRRREQTIQAEEKMFHEEMSAAAAAKNAAQGGSHAGGRETQPPTYKYVL